MIRATTVRPLGYRPVGDMLRDALDTIQDERNCKVISVHETTFFKKQGFVIIYDDMTDKETNHVDTDTEQTKTC